MYAMSINGIAKLAVSVLDFE